MERGQGYGMVSGMTLGIGDVVILPTGIQNRTAMSKQKSSITFWYGQDKKVQDCYTGDVLDPASLW